MTVAAMPCLPPAGPGVVEYQGHEFPALQLGPCQCLELQAGDIVGIDWDHKSGAVLYGRIKSARWVVRLPGEETPTVRLLEWETGGLSAHDREVLFSCVWRPFRETEALALHNSERAAS